MKNWHFSKGVTHGFAPNMAIFSTFSKCRSFSKGVNPSFWSKTARFSNFFFIQYRPGKWLLRYYRKKNAFLGYKNLKFKNSKNWHFSKRVNPWFWSKYGRFPTFLFGHYRLGKWLLRYSRLRKRLSRQKKQGVPKVEKLTFFQSG